MNVLEQTKALKEQAQVLAQMLGGNAVELGFVLTPQSFEDAASDSKEHWNGSKLWNRDAAQRASAEMVANGWAKHWDSNMGGDRYICLGLDPDAPGTTHLSSQKVRVMIHYTASVEDKCAELKKQLAELGCHY